MRYGEISDERARAIWRRAAELQAAAEARMEARTRLLAARSGGQGADGAAMGLAEVEEAAVEAGIAPEFVRIALAEGAGSDDAPPLRGWQERGARLMLGNIDAIEFLRVVQGTVDEVAAAALRVLQGHPYALQLRDVVDLPAGSGRLLIFGMPRYDWGSTANPALVTNAYMLGLRRVHATIRPLPGDPASCELLVTADVRARARASWRTGAWTAGAVGTAVGGVGSGLAVAMSASAALVALPAVAGLALGAGLTTLTIGWTVRYYRKAVAEMLDEAVAAIGSTLRVGTTYLKGASQ